MFEYRLERSKRKTLTICITGGEIIVKSPQRTSMEQIERFLAQKAAWIERKLAEYKRKTGVLEGVINGSSAMYHGVFLPIINSDKHKKIAVDENALYMPVKYIDKQAREKALAAWYKRVAGKELEAALAAVSMATKLKYKSFASTNARTKWGSCDGLGNIRLNWRLVMLDAKLIEYVIVHELSHTEHHDHSPAFWAEVAKHMPDYAAQKKRLKTYSVLTSLFR